MKINGIKFGINVDVAEFDLDLKDVVDIMRLEYEQRRELRKECHEIREAGPSSETKQFVESVASKVVMTLKEQIKDALRQKIKPAKKAADFDPDDRIED